MVRAFTVLLATLPFHGGVQGRSRLEWISELQAKEPYVPAPSFRRALQSDAALTPDNTAPIRLHLDFASLYEATAPQYTACFTIGEWYRRGLPRNQPTPPADGVPTCDSNGDGRDCWGICAADDLITPTGRDLIIQIVSTVAREVEELFSVRRSSPLTFTVDKGRYQRALIEQGWTPVEACASDCATISSLAVDSALYCTQGVDADAVLSVRRPPSESGVAGTGSHCQVDGATGRPTWLVFNWISPTVGSAWGATADVDVLIGRYRELVIHELLHTLGFSNSMFLNAVGASGQNKRLLSKLPVTDTDGATDSVWHFVRGRAYERAQAYFNCHNASDWQGLPLMGLPEIGRASHWETRIMRDDVMSYGGRPIVSSLTLAAMEDLGFYVANYSHAGCMNWGYQQGCAFVTSRCGIDTDDRSAMPQSSSECGGDPEWATSPHQRAYLQSKCAHGTTPCDTLAAAGFASVGGLRCNAQCYFSPTSTASRSDCTAAPAEPIEASGEREIFGYSIKNEWYQWLLLGVWALGVLAFLSCWRAHCCPSQGSACIVHAFSFALAIAGACLGAFGGYCLYYAYSEDTGHIEELVSSLMGKPTLVLGTSAGAFLVVLSLVTTCGIQCRSSFTLAVSFVVYVALLLVQMALTLLVIYWVANLVDVSADSLEGLRRGEPLHEGKFGARALSEAEGFTCRTYQTCCHDPTLLNNATCRTAHEGTDTVIDESVLGDPSSPDFCPFVSGARLSFTPADGLCNLFEVAISDFTLPTCRSEFCPSGIDGYWRFVQGVIKWMRDNGYWLGGVLALVCLLQLSILINLWNLRKRFRLEKGKRRKHESYSEGVQVVPTGRRATCTATKSAQPNFSGAAYVAP